MLTMAVFFATLSYALMTLSHMLLRSRKPDLERPYRTPGGTVTATVAFTLSLVAFVSTFLASPKAAAWSAGIYLIMVGWFLIPSRHHLVANAPEEEFEAIAKAERELKSASAGP